MSERVCLCDDIVCVCVCGAVNTHRVKRPAEGEPKNTSALVHGPCSLEFATLCAHWNFNFPVDMRYERRRKNKSTPFLGKVRWLFDSRQHHARPTEILRALKCATYSRFCDLIMDAATVHLSFKARTRGLPARSI
jgi:hypothetical protein